MKKIIIIVFLFSLNLNAQTIITDRPDQSESPSVIEPGNLQIETGFLISQIEEIGSLRNLNRKKNIYLPSTLFRIGLSNNIELRVFNQYQFQVFGSNLAHGFNDLEVGLKIQLLNKENSFTQIAFLSHALLPSAPSLFSDETFGSINKICVSHDLNGKIGVGYNLGYNYYYDEANNYTYSFVVGFEINEKISGYFEPYGSFENFDDSENNINAGITYLIKNNLQLDYSFGTGINHKYNFMSIGCSILIN